VGLTTPILKRLLSLNLKKILQLADASERGQGPYKAVEPMMMMMMMMMGNAFTGVSLTACIDVGSRSVD
jgi:hypothetical protein